MNLTELKKEHNKGGQSYRARRRWEPKVDQFKINTDSAWMRNFNDAGIGSVARDGRGGALMAIAAYHKSSSTLYYEMLAIKRNMP